MLKKDYTHIKIPEPEILAMKKANVLIDNYINSITTGASG